MNLAAMRVHKLGLEQPQFGSAHDLVAWTGAVQAQDYWPSLWALGQRIPGATVADVERAIADKQIVRLSFMRGTVHFVTGEDYRWMTALMGGRIRMLVNNGNRTHKLGWTEADFLRARDVIVKTLSGGTLMTKPELGAALAAAGFEGDYFGRMVLMWRAMADGLVCYGTHIGKKARVALADEWLPPSRSYTRDEALAEFARRYFQSHSPATEQDYAWWSGLTLTEARASIAMLGSLLTNETVNSTTYWYVSGTDIAPDIAPRAYLLPNYDEYLVAYKDRSFAFDSKFTPQLNYPDGIIFHHAVVICGRVVGTWTKAIKKQQATLIVHAFEPLGADEQALVAEAARRYGAFWGLETDVRYD